MSCDDATRSLSPSTKSAIWSAVQFVHACRDRAFNTSAKAADNVWDDHILLEIVGYSLADLVVHAEGNNFTANFSYRIVLQYRFENEPWQDVATPLVALQTSGSYVAPAVFSDRTKFGVRIRILVQTQTVQGAKTERGNLNIGVALRHLS